MLTRFMALALAVLPLLFTRQRMDYFTVIKWEAVHLVAIASLFFLPKKIEFPRINKWVLVALGLLSIDSIFIKNPQDWTVHLLDRASFVLLFIAFYNLKDLKWTRRASMGSCFLVIAYYIAQVFGYDPLSIKLGTAAASTFGNPNMIAQYLGLSMLLFLSGRGKSTGIPMAALSMATVYQLGCRSILLACALSLPLLLNKKQLLFTLALFGLFLAGYQKAPEKGDVVAKTIKENNQELKSQNIRLALWETTLKLYRDKPLGIGVGNFEFSLTPHQIGSKLPNEEQIVYSNPHNEFLRYLVEDGPLYLIVIIVIILMRLPFIRRTELGYIVFMGVESFLQFPLMNAGGLFLMALFFARIFREKHPITVNKRWPLVILVAFMLFGPFSRNVYSNYIFANFRTDAKKLELACDINKGHWRACDLAAAAYMHKGRYFDAQRIIYDMINRQPHHYGAIRLMMNNEFRKNLIYQGCYFAWKYDRYFENSSIKEDRNRICQAFEQHYNGLYGEN